MRSLWLALVLFLLPSTTSAGQLQSGQSWIILVSNSADISTLSKNQVINLFLGRTKFLPNGLKVRAYDFNEGAGTRAHFYQVLTGKHIAHIDAYWARLKYSGRASPPSAVENIKTLLERVQNQTSAITYLPSTHRKMIEHYRVKIVLQL